jgi:hypothetical protein
MGKNETALYTVICNIDVAFKASLFVYKT